jgi:histidine ammonia-lyase
MVTIDGSQLTINEVLAVAFDNEKVQISEQAKTQINKSQGWVTEIANGEKPVYGINTGFGVFSNKKIPKSDVAKLNRNLIISHAVGTGRPLPNSVVRAAMLIRANTLSSGYSGIRLVLLENLVEMLNKGVTPVIPSQGSLGSSGDLAPLSHMSLVLSKPEIDNAEESGFAILKGEEMDGKSAMEKAGIPRLSLQAKEGLALTNGATFSAAFGIITVRRAEIIMSTSEVALSMSLEALMGASNAFDARLHKIRNQTGQQEVAERVRKLTKDSTLLNAAGRVQDAYSIRCAPQVQGPARDTLEYVKGILEKEINAVTDNPLIFGPGEAISGGNFHGEPIGMALDFLKIAISEIGAISERRVFQLTDGKMNGGLPPMLVSSMEAAGLNSGMMMPQYTAASLVLENQTLAHPDSIHSLPTSGGKEDHNANAMTAARHAYNIANNCAHVLAIECYCAARALDLRLKVDPKCKMGLGTKYAHDILRDEVPYQDGDAWWGPEIEKVRNILITGKLMVVDDVELVV